MRLGIARAGHLVRGPPHHRARRYPEPLGEQPGHHRIRRNHKYSDGWTQGNTASAFAGEAGQWAYRNGAFYADKPASIARNLGLPDSAQIEFDLTWKGALNLAIALYTDSLQPILLSNKENGPDFGGFYSLQIQSVFMQLRRIKKHEPLGQSSLGDLVVPSLSQSNRVHMDLRASKAQHSVALLIDGVLIKQWVDPQGFAGEGKGMRFVENPPGGP